MNIQLIINNYKIKNIFFKNEINNNSINYKINKIFVINLIDNNIRRNYIICLMKKYKINFNLIIVERVSNEVCEIVDINKNISKEEVGCALSHLWCLNKIIKKNYNNAIIFEDDIVLHKDFINRFSEMYNYKHYDFLQLGACDFDFKLINVSGVKNNLYRPQLKSTKTYGAHANYYSINGAKYMYNQLISNFTFFDKNYHHIFNHFKDTSYICYPNLVVSDISTTNLNHEYDLLSNVEQNYYLNCFDTFNFTDYNFIYLDLILKNKNYKLNENEKYEFYVSKILNNYFNTENERNEIKNRLVMDFFTIKDIIFINNFKLQMNNSK